jgi:hypothetical protein
MIGKLGGDHMIKRPVEADVGPEPQAGGRQRRPGPEGLERGLKGDLGRSLVDSFRSCRPSRNR